MPGPPRLARALLLGLAVALASLGRADAQGPTPEPSAPTATGSASSTASPARPSVPSALGRRGLVDLVRGSNPMLWLLELCSIVTLGYILERCFGLRRGRVIPRDFATRFAERLAGGKLDRDRAIELCRSNDSPAARIFGHAARYWGQPAATIRQAVDRDAAREVLDLRRNVRVLNGSATLAPLLGLLGTVFGMIQSFDAIGTAGGNKGEALARGISLALGSTALGLAIAAVAIVAYYYFLNRVDLLVRDLDDQVGRIIDQISAEALRPHPADRRVDHPRAESRLH